MVVVQRIWLIPYIKFIVALEDYMPYIAIIFTLLLPIVSGLSYIDGIRRRNKILEAIEKKRAQKTELSKKDS